MKNKNMKLRIAIIVGTIFAVCVVAFVGLLLFAIGGEHIMRKRDWDNTYINSQYESWKTVTTSAGDPFKVPDTWGYYEENDEIQITDVDGNMIATGFVVRSDASVSQEMLLTKLVSFDVHEVKDESKFNVHLSRFGEVTAVGESQKTIPYIQLWKSDYEVFLYFSDTSSENNLPEIAEAVIYAFEFYDVDKMFQ